jgi:hypothetical protein
MTAKQPEAEKLRCEIEAHKQRGDVYSLQLAKTKEHALCKGVERFHMEQSNVPQSKTKP